MAHGNKKYFFEELKKRGDTITVKSANIYSLRNQIKIYTKAEDEGLKVEVTPLGGGEFLVERISAMSSRLPITP